MHGILDKKNPTSNPFPISGSEGSHNRLFAWGEWDGATLRVEVMPMLAVNNISGFPNAAQWFSYHEGDREEIEVEDDDGKPMLDPETKEPVTVEVFREIYLDDDGYLLLSNVSRLQVRAILEDVGEDTKVFIYLA